MLGRAVALVFGKRGPKHLKGDKEIFSFALFAMGFLVIGSHSRTSQAPRTPTEEFWKFASPPNSPTGGPRIRSRSYNPSYDQESAKPLKG